MRLKIAQVATADMSIPLLLRDQIDALESAGHEVSAVCGPGPRVQEIRDSGIRLHVIESMTREPSPASDLKALGELRRFFAAERFDVVHTHTPKAGLLGPMAARLARTPRIVHTIHGLLYHDAVPQPKWAALWGLEKATSLLSHHLLSQSAEDVEVARRTHLAPDVRYLGNGIDVARFSSGPGLQPRDLRPLGIDPDRHIVVGCVGRLVYEKGFAELFDAAQQVTRAMPDVRFLIVGPEEPDQNDALDRGAMEALKRSGVAVFTGWQAGLAEWYAAMDMFVLPSHREGIPRACMEASAMGLPVVATDIRGCREVVRDGETGLLVPVRDADALAAAITRLATDATLRARLGAGGARHIRARHDHRDVLVRLLAFYDEVEADLRGRSAA